MAISVPMKTSSSTALAPKFDQRLVAYAEDPAWQRAWLNIEAESWRSLAVIPTGDLSSLDLVHGLAAIAWQQRGTPLIVADLQSIGIPALVAARSELRRRIDGGDRILIATQSFEKNPTAATIAREADKALLCVYMGHSVRSHVRNAIRELGTKRCLGTIIVHGR
jgi:hypothetical protein